MRYTQHTARLVQSLLKDLPVFFLYARVDVGQQLLRGGSSRLAGKDGGDMEAVFAHHHVAFHDDSIFVIVVRCVAEHRLYAVIRTA